MKILLVVTRAEQGGAQTNVLSLAKALRARGEEVVVGVGDEGWLTERAAAAELPTVTFRHLRRSWNPLEVLFFVRELRLHLTRRPADIVHLHSSNALFGALAARSIGKSRKAKVVVTVHGLSILHPGWRGSRAVRFAYGAVMWTLWRLADRLVFVCRSDREFAVRCGFAVASKSAVVANGIAPDADCMNRAEARRVLALAPDDQRPVVGAVMRLQYAKDPDMFLDVARECGGRFLFALVGDGPELARVTRRIVEERLSGCVRLVTEARDACRLMRAFDVFLLPSRYEGSPYTVLEAALAGVPVAAANVGGVREIIENRRTGVLVHERSPQAFASALRYILERPPEAARMAAVAKARVLRMFGETRMVDGILGVYRDALRK